MPAPTTFREAFTTLKTHADSLRTQSEPDIDNLLRIVSESVEAYNVCKTRIDAVEKALEQALSKAGPDGGEPPASEGESASKTAGVGTAQKPAAGSADFDDDPPF